MTSQVKSVSFLQSALNLRTGLFLGIVVVLSLLLGIVPIWRASRRPKNFPPGPPTAPVLGNLHQLPITKPFLKFHEFSKAYGDLVGLKFGTQNVVLLNNQKHVRELFDRRSAKYSGRPHSYVANELVLPNEVNILFQPYGPAWRKSRKICQGFLNSTSADNLLPLQNAEVTQTISQILQSPEGFFDHIRRYSTAVILASIYGLRGGTFNDPRIEGLYDVFERYTAILAPGATPPIELLPFLKYLPGAWKKKARNVRRDQYALYRSLMEETKERLRQGKSTGSLMEQILRDQEKLELDDEHVAYMGGVMMEAGSDTTTSTLLSFILAGLEKPEVFKKAQQEIDEVCGDNRSPTPQDIRQLPYIEACMNETLRWRPVAPGGIPHMLTEDDVYGEYYFQKGTIFFANTWSIHRDELEYEHPDDFRPERFLRSKFGIRPDCKIPESGNDNRRVTYAFGASRRICQGQRMAENSLLLNMAKLLWTFDISPPADGSLGRGHSSVSDYVNDVQAAYDDGFVFGPRHFKAKFTPRSEKRRQIIEREHQVAKELLSKYE